MEILKEIVASPYFIVSMAVIVLILIATYHVRQVKLINTGLIKKPLARSWWVDYDRLRSGLWIAALGGVIAAAYYYENFGGWVAFWTLVAALGVGQVLASIIGQDCWYRKTYRRSRRHN